MQHVDEKDEEFLMRIAEAVHEVNRAYCRGLRDHSQRCWTAAPKWQVESAINAVRTILADPAMTPEQGHENWLEHKRRNGWVYGEKKDAEQKTHPCMVPYSDLPPEQRAKDTLCRTVVLGTAGLL